MSLGNCVHEMKLNNKLSRIPCTVVSSGYNLLGHYGSVIRKTAFVTYLD